MVIDVQATPYGSVPYSNEKEDISGVWAWSMDFRSETGAPNQKDESGWVQPGTFSTPVFPTEPGFYPVGEIRLMLCGQEVRLVGARTSREDLVEVTADEVRIMRKHPNFASQMRAWLNE